jgi:hypothetical protein
VGVGVHRFGLGRGAKEFGHLSVTLFICLFGKCQVFSVGL